MSRTSPPSTLRSSPGTFDWGLLAIVTAMLIYGVVMVFSASYPFSVLGENEHPWYFVSLQLAWIGVGLVVMFVAARIPYTIWEKWSVPLMAVTLITLLVLLVIGNERFGSTRTFIGGSVQPSQPAKVIITIYVAAWLASKGDRIRNVSVGLLPFAVGMGFLTVLIVLQPSISTAFLIVITASIMFFIAGAAVGQLLVIAIGGSATFWVIIRYSTYAGDRLQNYIESIGNPLRSNEFQVQQTVQALTTGGPVGVGIGRGTAQMPGAVPLAWSDNIYAVIGEELGLIGTLLVIALFALLAYRGLSIALRTRDPFGMLLAIGLTAMIILQAMLNMAVVVAVVPPTGVPLPFFSYGGSSLVTAMAAVGLLFSISRYGPSVRPRSSPSAGETKPTATPRSQAKGAR
jgi:cell division protein FtsW